MSTLDLISDAAMIREIYIGRQFPTGNVAIIELTLFGSVKGGR